MGRPEQHGNKPKSAAHKGKHTSGKVRSCGQRDEKGALLPGNTVSKGHGQRKSKGMLLRNALRDQVGEKKIRKLADELYVMAMSSELEPKERIAAIKTLLEYTVGKPAQEMAFAAETNKDGTTRIVFATKESDGTEKEL